MRYYLIFPLYFVILCFKVTAQDNNKIQTIAIIELLNDRFAIIEKDTVPINSVHKKVTQLLDEFNLEEDNFPGITLIVNPSVTENSIENIKYQIRSTPIQFINLQRKTNINIEGGDINQNSLDRYNSLITYWNSLAPEKRFYRESDLKFVESVASSMTINQRIKNKKLPGYLPFVKKESVFTSLSRLSIDSTQSYIFVYKKDTLEKNKALSLYKDAAYQLRKRIINEKNVNIIEIVND